MEKLATKIEERSDGRVSKASAKLYAKNYLKLKERAGGAINTPSSVLEAVKDLKPATQKTYLFATLRSLEAMNKINKKNREDWNKAIEEVGGSVIKERETASRDVDDIDFTSIVDAIDKKIAEFETRYPKKVEKLLQDKAIVLIHSKIPVRRARDQFVMRFTNDPTKKLIKDNEKSNWYNGKDFVFGDQKTAKTNGIETIAVPKEIKDVITRMLQMRDKHHEIDNDYLFLNGQGKPFSSTGWNQNLKRIFGGKSATNYLRKLQIKNNIDVDAVRKAEEIAEKMGHSIATQQRDYAPRD